MFNRRSHNAHPIYSRAKMHVEAFRWQVGLFLLHEGGRVTPKKAIEICFQDWPLELGINIVQLYDSLKTSLYTFQRASKEEIGSFYRRTQTKHPLLGTLHWTETSR
jgi:hypothetical protein